MSSFTGTAVLTLRRTVDVADSGFNADLFHGLPPAYDSDIVGRVVNGLMVRREREVVICRKNAAHETAAHYLGGDPPVERMGQAVGLCTSRA